MIVYDSGSQGFQELLKVYCISGGFAHFNQDSENNVVLLVQTQTLCSHDDILDINSSLSGICVKGEKRVKLDDMFWREDRVFSGDILLEDGLEIFL
jgi:hypothetical protein